MSDFEERGEKIEGEAEEREGARRRLRLKKFAKEEEARSKDGRVILGNVCSVNTGPSGVPRELSPDW